MGHKKSGEYEIKKYEIKVSVTSGDDRFDFKVYTDEYLTNFNALELKKAINNIIIILDKGAWKYASDGKF